MPLSRALWKMLAQLLRGDSDCPPAAQEKAIAAKAMAEE